MSAHGLFLVRMDVAHDHEKTFNDVYDTEHVPNLRAVPGVRRARETMPPVGCGLIRWPAEASPR